VLKPDRRVLGKTAAQKPPRRGRHRPRQERPVRLGPENSAQRVGDRLPVEGAPAAQSLEQDAPERPDVGAAVDRLAARLLGAHVRRGAEQDAVAGGGDRQRRRLGEIRPRLSRARAHLRPEHLGEAEVEHLRLPLGSDFDVPRFEIAVDDATLVRRLERCDHLPADAERFIDRQGTAGDLLRQRLPCHQLHRQEAHPA
jgi:hypothetical protein